MKLPSGEQYWTVLDDDLGVVAEADAFLRHVRFGRDGSELTTKSYAGGSRDCLQRSDYLKRNHGMKISELLHK